MPTNPCGSITLDGIAESAYGSSITTQLNGTGYGDSNNGSVGCANGSELDAAYGVIRGGVLYLTLTGNLESNGNKLNIFVDSTAGGQNNLRGDNALNFAGNQIDRFGFEQGRTSSAPGAPGLTFDSAFAPDYWYGINLNCFTLFMDTCPLPSGSGGTASFLGSNTTAGGDGTLSGGTNPDNIKATINNANIGGVTSGSAANAANPSTGVEIAIPLAAIGNPTGPVTVCAFVSDSSYTTMSNQILGSFPAGTGNPGSAVCSLNFQTGFTGNQYFTVNVNNTTPSIVSVLPASASACVGGSASFTVSATGAAPLSYQWRKYPGPVNVSDGSGISGSGTATISFNPAAVGHAGTYDVVVTNACGSATSNQVTLTIQAAPTAEAGPNQTVCGSATATMAGSSSNSASCAWSTAGDGTFDDPSLAGAVYTPGTNDISNGSVVLTYTCQPIAPCATPASDTMTLTIGSIPADPTIALSPDPICVGQAGTLTATVGGGETADWYSGSCPGGTLLLAGSTTLPITATPSDTYYARARNTTTGCLSAGCASITVSGETPPSVSAGGNQTICAGATVTLAGTSNISNHVWTTSGDGSFDNANSLTAVYTPGTNDIAIELVSLTLTSTNSCGFDADTMQVAIHSPVAIAPQPAGGTVGVGSSFSFTIGATGGGLSYQWRKYPGPVNVVNGGNISGALTNSLTINPVGLGDAGTYDCLVTNVCGSLASDPATLNVNAGATVSLVPTQTCIDGNKLIVEINLSSAPTVIVGGQFFLAYDTNYLTLLTADPGDAPFTREIYDQEPVAGNIDYAVGIPDGGTGTSANTTMARLSFGIVQNLCTPTAGLVWWRASGPNGAINQLSDANGDSVGINPVDLTAIKIDNMAPVLTGCPPTTLTLECGATPPTYTVTANDNCDGAIEPTYSESAQTPGVCPVKYTYTRTWTATDACGNTDSCSQLVTVQDTTGPVLSGCPAAPVTIECGDSPPSYTVTAEDGCDGTRPVTYSESAQTPGVCPVKYTYTRTWTATDLCNNSTSCSQLVTVQDTTAPVLSGCPPTTLTLECGDTPPSYTVTANDACQGTITPGYSESAHTPGVCPVKYTYTRTWTATDACGNSDSCSQLVTVEDNTAPVLTGCPTPTTLSVQCYADVPATQPVSASDACDGTVSVSFSETQSNPGSSCNNVITRTWTAVDACNNTASCSQTITVNDTTAPVLSGCPTGPVTIECGDSPPSYTVTANDACQGTITPVYSESAQTPGVCPVKYTYTRTWTATDACGNSDSCSQLVTVEDNTAPVLTGCPTPTTLSVQCYADVPATQPVSASDACDGTVSVSFNETQSNPGSSCNNVITRTWTAVDACNNTASCSQTITVNDTIAPSFTCPSFPPFTPAAGSCTVNPTFPPLAGLLDNCDPNPSVSYSPAGPYGPGTTPVTVTVTDACGNSDSCVFNVVVNNYNELVVDVELGGGVMAAGPYNRCITFELWNGASLAYTTSQTFNFTSGNIAPQTLQVPCGTYTCVTARDRLHTLRRTISPLPTVGTQYSADFTGPKKLIGGNLNDDKFIDILDFGIYTIYDLTPVNPNTNCTTVPPTRHANINGDLLVDSLDFSFISNNFLQVREANCDGNPNTITAGDNSPGGNYGPTPITSITVGELAQRGMPELAAVDLNHDGVLNQTDVQLWMQGVRPGQNPGTPGRPGTGGPTRPVDIRPIGIGTPAGRD